MDKIKKFAPLGAAVLGFVAVLMIFVAAVGSKINPSMTPYTGLEVVFGKTVTSGVLSVKVLDFSFVNLLPYLFAIGGIACAVLSYMKGDKKFALIATALFVVAGVLFFFAIAGLQAPAFKDLSAEQIKSAKENLTLGAGPIVAAILSFLAAACAAAPTVLEKLGK